MRRVLYVHSAICALLRSVPRPAVSMGLSDRRLTLLVRVAIAQYVDDANRFISKNWLQRPDYRLPSLCLGNAAHLRTLGLTVVSSSGPTWIRRNTDFVRILTSTSVTQNSLTFLRVLHTIRTELALSEKAYSGKCLLLFKLSPHILFFWQISSFLRFVARQESTVTHGRSTALMVLVCLMNWKLSLETLDC